MSVDREETERQKIISLAMQLL